MNPMAHWFDNDRPTNFSVLDHVNIDPPTFKALLTGEQLANVVRRALRDDAATRRLDVEVEVWDRVAHLRGVVATREEVKAAETVAARVRGIAAVADDLDVQV